MLGYLLFILFAVFVIDELSQIKAWLQAINKNLNYITIKIWADVNDEEED